MVPLVCRKTVNYIILFKTTQKKEIESLWSETSFLTRDELKMVLDYVFDKKYNFLVMDRDDNSYWKMFNKLIITDTKTGETNENASSSNLIHDKTYLCSRFCKCHGFCMYTSCLSVSYLIFTVF